MNMGQSILFSLIVPMYNCEKHIERCLQSIKAQTFKGYEVLLVDDGSTDQTVKYCSNSIENDEHFKIITQDRNMGVSAARNRGLSEASGKWIWFIDADDWIEPAALESIACVLDECMDLISFDFIKEREGRERRIGSCMENGAMIDRKGFCQYMLSPNCNFQLIWSNIYNCNFLIENNLVFDEELKLAEDTEFTVRVGKCVKYGKILRESLYHYVVNMESASQKWQPGFGNLYMESIQKIQLEVAEIYNPSIEICFHTFVKDVVCRVILKDIFHPDNKITWANRKMQSEDLLKQSVVEESMKEPYEGNFAHKLSWSLIIHRVWIPLAGVSYLYYRNPCKLFKKYI